MKIKAEKIVLIGAVAWLLYDYLKSEGYVVTKSVPSSSASDPLVQIKNMLGL